MLRTGLQSIESPYTFIRNTIYNTPEIKNEHEKDRVIDYIINMRHHTSVCVVTWETIGIKPTRLEIVNDARIRLSKLYYNLLTLKMHPKYTNIVYTIQTYLLGVMKLLLIGIHKYGTLHKENKNTASTPISETALNTFPLSEPELIVYAQMCINPSLGG